MERNLIAAAVSSALALPMAAQAVEFSVSGQVHRSIVSIDGGGEKGKNDAHDGDIEHVDGASSQTRFRFTGSEEMENGMTVGVNLEYGLTANMRHAASYLDTAGGKLTFGHTAPAADGAHGATLSGPAGLADTTNACNFAGTGSPACINNGPSRQPILKYETPAIGPATISVSTGNNDYWDAKLVIGGSFGDAGYDLRVGYISEYEMDVGAVPESNTTITGKQLMTALEADGFTFNTEGTEIVKGPGGQANNARDRVTQAIKGHNKLNKVTVSQAGAGDNPFDATALYNKNVAAKAATTEKAGDVLNASAAVSFGQGTSVAVAWGVNDTTEHEYQFVRLGHSYGDGSVAVYYKQAEMDKAGKSSLKYDSTDNAYTVKKGATMNHEGSLWGVGWGHNIGAGAKVYAGYRQISEDGMNDIDLILAGMNVTFN